jgi:hypothetical protein
MCGRIQINHIKYVPCNYNFIDFAYSSVMHSHIRIQTYKHLLMKMHYSNAIRTQLNAIKYFGFDVWSCVLFW